MGVTAASDTQHISANQLLLRCFSATQSIRVAWQGNASSVQVATAETELALVCGEGVAAMDIADDAELVLESSFNSELVLEEQTERLLRLFGAADASAKEEAIGLHRLSDDPHDQIFALYDEYRPRLFGYLRSFHLRREEAEEIIQETFLRLTTALVRKSEFDNVQGWIIRVAHHLAVDAIKRKVRDGDRTRDVSVFEFDSIQDQKLDPEETLLKKEQRKQMETALLQFSPMQCQCFHMRAQGFRYKDIGLALGISTQRVALIVKQVTARLAAICG